MQINPSIFLKSLFTGEWVRSVEPLPKDAQVLSATYDPYMDLYNIAIQSASYPEIGLGELAPTFNPVFERLPIERII